MTLNVLAAETFSSQLKLFIVDDTHHGVVIVPQMP